MAFSVARIKKFVEFTSENISQSSLSRAEPPIIVGWGTKGTYQQKKRMYGGGGMKKIDILVDSDPEQHGKVIDGLTVYSPLYLESIDAENTAIIIFSVFVTEIEETLKSMGFLYYSPPLSYQKISLLENLLKLDASKLAPDIIYENFNDTGVVIQGVFDNELTSLLIRALRRHYPRIKIILSTWNTAGKQSIEGIEGYVDQVILLEDVPNAGHLNRNRQSYSTHEGLKAIKQHGCSYALKIRSDLLIGSSDFLETISSLWSKFPNSESNKAKGKIIVPESFSRVAMPFHPSDMVMYGHVDDLLLFWDTGHNSLNRPLNTDSSIWDYCMEGGVPEVEFAMNYCLKLNCDLPTEYEDALIWLCKHFLFVDDEVFNVFWPKMALNVTYPLTSRLFSHALWRAIAEDNKAYIVANCIDPKKLSWQDHLDSQYKWMAKRCKVDKKLHIPEGKRIVTPSGYFGVKGLYELFRDKLLS